MRTENPIDHSKSTVVFTHWVATLLPLACISGTAGAATMAATEDISELSLEQLMDIKVTSVSKRAQKISEAPAAVTVLSAEDIRRSGATSIPEALRLVPGLHVAHIDNNRWAITARGFNGASATKLLVLIDGRSVYSPLFSGVFWDANDVVPEDIDRIEVVRGPGGTLWGANAVNGVINIITKKSSETDGAMLSGGGGSLEDGVVSLRYGHKIGENLHARVYGKYVHTDTFDPPTVVSGEPAHVVNDARRIGRAGFRMDWDAAKDNTFTFQGDFYDGDVDFTQLGSFLGGNYEAKTEDPWGVNLLARWEAAFSETHASSVQVYYDHYERESPVIDRVVNTFDVELQDGFQAFRGFRDGFLGVHLTLGADYRLNWNDIENSDYGLAFAPSSSTDHLISGFIQDEITLVPDLLTGIVGIKLEHNDFSGFEYQPNARLLLTPHPRHTIWAAVSRAVRTPSRKDSDLNVDLTFPGASLRVWGSRSVEAEDLLAVEVGYRAQPHDRISFDVAAYYNKYDDLIGQQALSGPPNTEIRYANNLEATGWGVEASATCAVLEFEDLIAWRLKASYTYMDVDVDPDADRTTPLHQAQVHSQLDLPWNLEADAALYYVGKVQANDIDDYVRLDLRLGWQPTENIELSVVGRNLQERRHLEFGPGTDRLNSNVPRSLFAKLVLEY